MTFSEPEVMLLVMLLRAVLFVSLRKYGAFGGNVIRGLDIDSLEFVAKVREAVRGKSRKGMIQ
jgi:hypothetical protein